MNPIRFTTLLALFVICAFLLVGFTPAQTDPIPVPDITAASLVVILAGILSLTADYFPGVAAWFDTLLVSQKRLVMVAGAVVIVGAVFAGECFGLLKTNLSCTPAGVVDVVSNILLAFAVGQGVHEGAKPTPAFKKNNLDIDPKFANGKTPVSTQ